MEFPDLLERFLSYVKIDTQSDEESETFPSTEKQLNLAHKLEAELLAMGLDDVHINEWGYVFGSLKSNKRGISPRVALIAHMDTSPEVSGTYVRPVVHESYDGRDLILSKDSEIVLRVEENQVLKEKIGNTLITTDGKTLLGADDKAGIAEIMSALDFLIRNPDYPRPNIRVLFTPDEEVGKGTEKLTYGEIEADIGYTVDGGEAGVIEDETFCADTVEVRIQGVNVHPGYAKGKMINSIKIASDILEQFPKGEKSPETTEKREGYIHPHFLSGSVEASILKILIRDFEVKGLEDKENFIRAVINNTKSRYPEAVIDMDIKESYRNMKQVLKSYPDVIEKAEKATRQSGLKPVRKQIRGGTDGARLCFMGLPTPNLFTGGNNFHSRYEWISLEDMEKAAEVIVRLMALY